MRLKNVEVLGYRSLREFRIRPKRISVIVGANGSGKSNFYNSLQLLQSAATGQFARRIVDEGGMGSVLWAGDAQSDNPGKAVIKVEFNNMSYLMRFGYIPESERRSDGDYGEGLRLFNRDPDIKLEKIELLKDGKFIPLLKRKRGSVVARNMDGRTVPYAAPLEESESVLSALREPHRFPEVFQLRSELMKWRFYHTFRTDLHSPIRRPQRATLTPILSNDGHDLASAIGTIWAIGDKAKLERLVDEAFPGSSLMLQEDDGVLEIYMRTPGVFRALSTKELSDGTLQYLLLLGALMTPRPAPLLVLNEPESSIHPDLVEPLAEMIMTAGKNSQVIITTHSTTLASRLSRLKHSRMIELEKVEGETKVKGQKVSDALEDDDDWDDEEDDKEEEASFDDWDNDEDDD